MQDFLKATDMRERHSFCTYQEVQLTLSNEFGVQVKPKAIS